MARRATKGPSGKPPGRKRTTISLPPELARQLATFAAWHGLTQQFIVTELLRAKLQGFYASQLTARGTAGEASPAVQPGLAPSVRLADQEAA